MGEGPLFSIVIPSYNRADFIKKTINSFLQQTYTHFELIIVDDGSRDNTKAVVELINDPRVKYFWKENGERGAARNYGAMQATGDYINFFDSDDLSYPMHLETASRVIKELGKPMVFHLGYEMKTIDNQVLYQRELVHGNGNNKLLKVNYVNPNPVFVHKDTLKEVLVSEDRKLSGTEDWLYHLRLAARYDFIAKDETITCCMIQHDERSMNSYSGDNILLRNTLLLQYLKEDTIFMNRYGNRISGIAAEMMGLAALHYALENKKTAAIKYLFKCCAAAPVLLFKRRTLAIIKYLLIKWK